MSFVKAALCKQHNLLAVPHVDKGGVVPDGLFVADCANWNAVVVLLVFSSVEAIQRSCNGAFDGA